MADAIHAIPRRAGAGHAVIVRRSIDLVFQRYPGTEAASGIQGLNYEVVVGSAAPIRGATGADGKITVRVGAGQIATVRVMGAEYHLSARSALEASNTLRGVQRRLNMLGYNAGAVDGGPGPKTEYAILNFQADNAPLLVDGLTGPNTQRSLRTKVGE